MVGGEMMDDRREAFHPRQDASFGFAAGLLTGMVCGGVLALLFAPKEGSALRGDINSSVGSMKDALGRRYRDVAQRAGAAVSKVQEKAQGMAADARDYVHSKTQRPDTGLPTQH